MRERQPSWPTLARDRHGWPRPPHFVDAGFSRSARAMYDAMRFGQEDRFDRLLRVPMRRLLAAGMAGRVAPRLHGARFGTGLRALRGLVAYVSALCVERNRRFILRHGGIEALMGAVAPVRAKP